MKKSALAFVLAIASVLQGASAGTPGEVAVGNVLREAQMKGLIGPARKLSAYRGKPLIINVWASWCGPCREEMGSLERLNRRFGGQQFNVIGISTDDYEDRATTFIQKTNITFSNFLDSKLNMENMLGADHLPLTLLVDAQGRVLGKFYGSKQWDGPEALTLISRTFRIKL